MYDLCYPHRMPRKSTAQVNIRSTIVRDRVAQLVAETGKTMTQVVEDAVTAYRPQPPVEEILPEGLVRRGRFLVFKGHGGPKITLEDTNRAIEAGRNRDLWGDEDY